MGSEGNFFFNLSMFHSSCADLISTSSTDRTAALSLAGKLGKAEGNQSQCSGLFPYLSLSVIHLSPGNWLMFPVSGLVREDIPCAA